MRIVYIAAGAGDMYCGACARDIALIRALIARGHDVQVYPLYTPLRLDGGAPVITRPITFGGINVYLQQLSPLFQHLPQWLARVLDGPGFLNWVSRFAIHTKAEDVGPLTVSMLAGRNGRQRVELDRLLDFLAADTLPDVVNITNSLLSGIAPALKERLGVPIVCNVQGEDLFVAGLPALDRERAHALIRAHAASVDLYLAPGEAYARYMTKFLDIAPAQMRVARAGVDVQAYYPDGDAPTTPFIIGYLSVIIPSKGLDLLVEALRRLVHEEKRDVHLHVAGKVLNPGYAHAVRTTIADAGLQDRVVFLGEVDYAAKIAFLRTCSVVAATSRHAESRALATIEAMACGVPVVMPHSGIFLEIRELTDAGDLYTAGDSLSLAKALSRVMDDPTQAHTQATHGIDGIVTHFSAQRMADDVLAAYATLPGIRATTKTR